MQLITDSQEFISSMKRIFFHAARDAQDGADPEPLRAELYSSGQMAQLGRELAAAHVTGPGRKRDLLLHRLSGNEAVLQQLRRVLADSVRKKQLITPAGEWLLDNFYIVEEQIRIAKRHLPKKYSEGLPQLSGSTPAGQARIYDIIVHFIAHSDGKIAIEHLSGFIKAYQDQVPLNLGELWAIPIMLRIALIENTRRVAAQIGVDRVNRNLADYWVAKITETAEAEPERLIFMVAEMVASHPPMESAFVCELIRQLRGKGPEYTLVLNWIEQQLAAMGLSSTGVVNIENQKQSADQVSISNSINSLRSLAVTDWRAFVESHSVVEHVLRGDPQGTYALMDFTTRDRYRHIVEYISKKSNTSEPEVARLALGLSSDAKTVNGAADRRSHVGYFLVDDGVRQTQTLAGAPVAAPGKLHLAAGSRAAAFYFGGILLVTLAASAVALFKAYTAGITSAWLLAAIAPPLVLCLSQFAVSVMNFVVTQFVKPLLLPRMDFAKGIPFDSKSLVVIPSMLANMETIDGLAEGLEVRYLANRDKNLHFGLLTDFEDSLLEHQPQDDALLGHARARILKLNEKYGRRDNDLFFLFHRPRQWNPQQQRWMGYERKRGKLSDLNALLRDNSKERFSLIIGEQSVLPLIRYVITLDADTQLPLNAAWKLVGTMAHPLNRPLLDQDRRKVVEGYGILQPRVTLSIPDSTSSRYRRMYSNQTGIDPYTRASSDVYQDLFGEGSFIGKGIYDVDIFHKVLNGRFLENRILSHDLLEGCYVRSALVSDVQLFEQYPGTYQSDLKTRMRWVRGDWQIFAWFLPQVPAAPKHWEKNPLSLLSRWKVFDNLRRSLVPAALTLLLLLGWTVMPYPVFWTVAVSTIIVFPVFIAGCWDLVSKPRDVILKYHFRNAVRNLGDITVKTMFGLICLPHEAFVTSVVILRTIWRLSVSKRKLLEWVPSSSPGYCKRLTLGASYASMWIEPVLAVTVFTYITVYTGRQIILADIILLLWVLAPGITWFVNRAPRSSQQHLSDAQDIFLHKLARRTWGFFEHFVTPENNWLPPDNFQLQPVEQTAHRTSPTNIGLSLLSVVTACDFGYIAMPRMLQHASRTLSTMAKMERYKGHFYNWYDTRSLSPLLPKYISTVDSGNLAGHLLVVRQALAGVPDKALLHAQLFTGIHDTLQVLAEYVTASQRAALMHFERELTRICGEPVQSWHEFDAHAGFLALVFGNIAEELASVPDSDCSFWTAAIVAQLEQLRELTAFATPWLMLHAAPEGLSHLRPEIMPNSLRELVHASEACSAQVLKLRKEHQTPDETSWLDMLYPALLNCRQRAAGLLNQAQELVSTCEQAADMEWEFLYDHSNHLLRIGYNVQDHIADGSFYDLLSSEVRLCVFTCIAQRKLPEESWFALGRLLTNVDGIPILLSWSGSMFEYLMPLLVMPTYDNTLLDQTMKAAVAWQIKFGERRNLPWGISESGYNMINANATYQYRAFGVKGLGLKRGLDEDIVIAPYASALALALSPQSACRNLMRLAGMGLGGRFGLYEAVDYTPSRLQRGERSAIVYSFMAHHQGMTLLSLAYLLRGKPMQKLFNAVPEFKAASLLLQERIPRATAFFTHTTDIAEITGTVEGAGARTIVSPGTPVPEVQLLSNGRYHVMLTAAGGSYSRWKELAVTRWREDCTRDNWGTFCYIHDVETASFWSVTYQPTLEKTDTYEAVFSLGRADYHCTRDDLESRTEIVVSPEDDIEIRSISLTNTADRSRIIEITSYAEVVLAPPGSDLMQPLFNNLFVETEILAQQQAILCTRRTRSAQEQPPWMFHLMSVSGNTPLAVSFETDRAAFIGRGGTPRDPQAMGRSGRLSGAQGAVIDPIVAIRYRLKLEPEEKVILNVVTGVAETRDECMHLVDKYRESKVNKARVFEMAWTHAQVLLREINVTEAAAQLYERLAGSILFANAAYRAAPVILANNRRQQSGLWGYAISGDLPIVLLKIGRRAHMQLVRDLIQAHIYWRLKGLTVDLFIWNEEQSDYRQALHTEIQAMIPVESRDRPGGIFLRAADQIAEDDKILFQAVARLVLCDDSATLADLVSRKPSVKRSVPNLVPTQTFRSGTAELDIPKGLSFWNGLGGFSADGREYVVVSGKGSRTPAPWVNVIANPSFGTVISESGSSYTWTENAHELRLTPWNCDPVTDLTGEAFYLRDEETGVFWSPALLPAGSGTLYVSRHGFGYSVFEHIEAGIHSEMTVFVDMEMAVKFTVLKISNKSGKPRKLSATGYVEWVLGDSRSKTAMHVRTELDTQSGAIFAKNTYSPEFLNRTAFFCVDESEKSFTADRSEFIGRNRSLEFPDAMLKAHLSGRTGAGLDPCCAIQVPFSLAAEEEREIVFRLGAGRDHGGASDIVRRTKGRRAAAEALDKVHAHWHQVLGVVQVNTPDASVNILANGWLLYQTLSSRIWGRSGFYQSGGAYGFRDQLQDVLALLHAQPRLARAHILLCASRQFSEGDVQHWWHPPAGRGVRTRISDDYLWLPFVTAAYIEHTGDIMILKEESTLLHGRLLSNDEVSYYDLPLQSIASVDLYDHCVLAIRHGLSFGAHGLPLIGTGDWNDGYDRIGHNGKGESVWLGFFLYDILNRFVAIAELRNDPSFVDLCRTQAAILKDNLDKFAWDGQWYKRAWFDSGAQLGVADSDECQIDSLPQSWSVLSGASGKDRSSMAMESAYARLVKKDHGLIQLLEPAFDRTSLDPGYIKGYIPGVRENGGQYSHAAMWLIIAFARLGNNERVWELINMVNPINHARTAEQVSRYKVEPYVVASDVYSGPLHAGRGGWTWYTGAAGWMYQLLVGSLLGLRREANKLKIDPCIPENWKSVSVTYRYGNTTYQMELRQADDKLGSGLLINGCKQKENTIVLEDDGLTHKVLIVCPKPERVGA